MEEKKDGEIEFKVEARGLDLGDIDLNNPVFFSLQIGFDYSESRILFDDRGRFRRGDDDDDADDDKDRDKRKRKRKGKRKLKDKDDDD